MRRCPVVCSWEPYPFSTPVRPAGAAGHAGAQAGFQYIHAGEEEQISRSSEIFGRFHWSLLRWSQLLLPAMFGRSLGATRAEGVSISQQVPVCVPSAVAALDNIFPCS